MAASLSRPDPSSPASVAEAGFTTARRGFSQDEVRAFLVSVAAELGRLQERERQLEAELNDLRAAGGDTLELDDATVERMLGEETLRVLQTARESASQIKIRAEENAARIIGEANDESNRLRQEAEVEAARRRQDAAADAEAEVALAKQQGREMVNEARSYRERVLADLDRRTTLARKQIEELVHGRDRLLQVFERARLVAVDVTSDLRSIDGPEELVNLDPTTGPVPLMVPRDRSAGAAETDVDESGPDDATADDGSAPETAPETDAETDAENDAATEAHDHAGDDSSEAVDTDVVADVEVDAESDVVAEDVPQESASETPPSAERDANVVSLFRGRTAPSTDGAIDDELADDDRPDVGGIFERLREEADETSDDAAGDAAEVDAADPADADSEPEPTAFTRRDEAIVPLIVAAARKLKRVLADEQNEVLDTLRQKDPVTELAAVVPDTDEHARRYVEAIGDELLGAAAAGAGEFGANDTKTLRRKLAKAGALEQAHQMVRRDLIAPLRDRLERSIADGAGDNDDITKRIRAVYREWKTQHIDDQLDDVFRAAHGGGVSATAEPGSPLTWTVDPSEAACPDCEDNSLAGPVPAGEPYPTGHTTAPAHAGCRCLTLPASG